MIARPASDIVTTDVTTRVPAGSRFVTAVSCSRSAATSAVDSTYRTCVVATARACEPGATIGGDGRLLELRFATICVNQFGGRATREADVRPILKRIAGFKRWPQNPSRNELVPTTPPWSSRGFWWNDLRHDAAMSRNRNALTGFYAPNVPAQVVFQLTNARGGHYPIIATCGPFVLEFAGDLVRSGLAQLERR